MILRVLPLSLVLAAAASAQQDNRSGRLLAVLEFNSKLEGAEKKAVDVQYLADTVRAAVLDAVPDMRVMTRENEMVLLEQSGKKLSECEGECEVDTGRRLGADLVISGDLLKFGSAYKLNLKLHETHDGRLLSGAQASGRTIDELDADTQIAVRKLLKPLTGDTGPRQQTQQQQQQQQQQQPQPYAPPKPQPSGRGPRLAIGTTSSKTYDISIRAAGKIFTCPQKVTENALCELYGVPTGPVTLVVRGDANQERDFNLPADGLRVMIDARGKWPTILGLSLIGGGAALLYLGSQAPDTGGSAAILYAYGGIIGVTGLVFFIIGAARSPVTYNETTGEALRLDDGNGIRLAGLGVAPLPGGAMAGATFRF